MPLKTPKFWYRSQSSPAPLIERLLTPFSALYRIGQNMNLGTQQTKSIEIPVICIGNITAGGSGKTPTIIALHKLLIKHGLFKSPYFLSRGYGGSENKTRCIEVHDDAKIVGDEPLLLANHSKTIISVNRYDGAELMHDLGADCILMDDGFQNRSLHKDISLLVIDGKTGLGNRKLLPSGPLREPIDAAFQRAQAVIIIGEDQTDITSLIPKNITILKASIQVQDGLALKKEQSYIAFAGLGHPRKFYDTLKKSNMNITAFHEFADHQPYSQKDINTLLHEAKQTNAKLLTTEKDYQRIPQDLRDNIDVFPIELIWQNEDRVIAFLKKELKGA
ncbi:MAG: tetraacyldisaccharide 4'-kinase [Alphaproteobacteria bacterium]|nr:MAG: tetraacyldisaccharide 4'-kinase [Alphaproteobacteria bacterium]